MSITMPNFTARRLTWFLCALTLVCSGCVILLALGNNTAFIYPSTLFAIAVSAVVGALIVMRRSNNSIGWLLLLSACCRVISAAAREYTVYGVLTNPESLPFAAAVAGLVLPLNLFGYGMLLFLPLVFPDGRLLSAWWRPIAYLIVGGAVAVGVLSVIRPGPMLWDTRLTNPFGITALGPLFDMLNVVAAVFWPGILLPALSLVVRFRRARGEERLQMMWLMYAVITCVALVIAASLVEPFEPTLFRILDAGVVVAFAAFPVAIGVAVMRYRLYAIDMLINRTLVYGSLIVCIVAIDLVIVGGLSLVLKTSSNLLVALITTSVVLVLFAPLRERLRRAVNRVMYGKRDDPYAVIAGLSRRLAAAMNPEAVLPTIVETVRAALNLPYAAIAIDQDSQCVAAASSGIPTRNSLRIPLRYQGEQLGELILGPRAPGAGWSSADHQLLADLVQHAGTAVHAVRLTLELQQARARLVAAREEERRRLRRDLHDGLGPVLAMQAMQADAAREILHTDPTTAEGLLNELAATAQDVIGDVRRLVHALRPPALDDLGLVGALRAQASAVAHGALQVSIQAPEPFPPLPAAVEVAAYRIVQEAVTNVVRHAGASQCTIRLHVDQALHVVVIDNGCGVPANRQAGVGLSSMRERATELGGMLRINALPHGGTEVVAWLPLNDTAVQERRIQLAGAEG